MKEVKTMETMDVLKMVFQKNLNNNVISETDNIFDLGGDSITVYKICSELNEVYGYQIKPIDIMTYPNLSKLCACIKGDAEAKKDISRVTQRKNLSNRRTRRNDL